MNVYKIYNTNDSFGVAGPFEVKAESFESAYDELADEMESCFEDWTKDKIGKGEIEWADDAITKSIADMRSEFISGLKEFCEE